MGSNNSKPIVPSSLSPTTTIPKNDPSTRTTSVPVAAAAKVKEDPSQSTPPSPPPLAPKTTGGCPMHNSDGTYSFDWWKVISGEFFTQHGPTGPTPLSKEEAELKTQSSNLTTVTPNSSAPTVSSGCPVKHNSVSSTIPLAASLSANGGGCPVKHQGSNKEKTTKANSTPEYNVYGQPIDPMNNMPYNPNQLPSYDQTIPLSTHRVASSIPKGGGGGGGGSSPDGTEDRPNAVTTWLYPSPQMFYNALQRKNKLIDDSDVNAPGQQLQPQDIESVVAIHNNMNEKTWYKILQWESIVHHQPIDEIEPKLLKFQGRPMDLSPKAAIKYYLFGHPLPYDRHDWIVERKNGTSQQRYVIDYYYDAALGREDPESAIPDLHDRSTGSPSLLVDVRPALDSVTALYHRVITMPYAQYMYSPTKNTSETSTDPLQEKYEYLPLWPSSTMKSQVNESIQVWQEIRKNSYATASEKTNQEDEKSSKQEQLQSTIQEELMQQFQDAVKKCQKEQLRMNQACSNVTDSNNDDDNNDNANTQCAKASIDLTLCMGSILCPIQQAAFRQTIQQSSNNNNNNDTKDDSTTIIDDALTRLQDCLKYKSQRYQLLKKEEIERNVKY